MSYALFSRAHKGIVQSSKNILGAVFIALFLLQAVEKFSLPILDKIEAIASDTRLIINTSSTLDERIIIADIDEASLQHYGQWPWNRHHLAKLNKILFEYYDIRTLGYDIVFAEPTGETLAGLYDEVSEHSGISVSGIQAAAFEALQDKHFSESLKYKNITLGLFFNPINTSRLNTLPEPLAELESDINNRLGLPKPPGFTANLTVFQQAASSIGFVDNPLLDSDGIFRKVPLFQSYLGRIYPSLALAVTRQALGEENIDIQMVEQGPFLAIETVQLGHRIIPTDANGAVYIPFKGPEGSFPYLPVHDILAKRIPKQQLKDKIVLLGTSAPGLLDLRSTPLDGSMPGVEIHANIIAGILDQSIVQKPSYLMGLEVIIYLLLGILLLIVPQRLSPLSTLIFAMVLAAASLTFNLWLWNMQLMFPISPSLLMILWFYIFHMSWGFFVESKHKSEITKLFGQYVPPDIVSEMAKQPEAISLEGQSREMTVLFSDVRNFTSLSENMPPKELTQLINRILTPMTEAIYRNMGTVDKYIGDAVMAFWGAPLEEKQHANKAVLSALGMQKKIQRLSKQLQKEDGPEIKIGIGINSGLMSVGNMGSKYRMAYTAMGDAVNLGARLEGLSKIYGARIVVSEHTQRQAPNFLYRKLDKVRVKGKQEPITILEPLMRLQRADDSDIHKVSTFHKCLDHYNQLNWSRALVLLDELATHNDPVYQTIIDIYRQRILGFQKIAPPNSWDGVYTHTSK